MSYNEFQARETALHAAVSSGAKGKDLIPTASAAYDFLTSGNASDPTAKPAPTGASAKKDAAPKAGTAAQEQSSDKPVEETTAKASTTSPSDKGAGFAADGSEIDIQAIRSAAVAFWGADGNAESDFLAILGEFGAAKISDVDSASYAELLARLQQPVASNGAFD